MEATQFIRAALAAEGITECGFLPRSHFRILNERLMQRCGDVQSAVMFLIPYRCATLPRDGLNISLYARVKDYHTYFSALAGRLTEVLTGRFPGERFYGFCDHSPIDEKAAAAQCGLGILGRNSLLINRTYGSFVFIGSLLTSMVLCGEESDRTTAYCCGCGRCKRSCPVSAITGTGIDRARCLSAITQKKHKTPEEEALLRKTGAVWGCDICQLVCPMNAAAAYTEIPFFKNSFADMLSAASIEAMSDEEFALYAFSWRGRNVITENIRRVHR